MPPTSSSPAARTPGRRGWIAAVLGFLLCGLGQLYAGRWRRALLFFFGDAVGFVVCLLAFIHIRSEPLNLWLPVVVYLGYRLWVIVDGVRLARHVPAGFRGPWFTHPYACVVLFLLYTFVGSYHFAVLLRDHVAHPYFVPTMSMRETLLPGDHFFVDQLFYAEPARGDVVAFARTDTDGSEQVFVDRIVGLPGERVQVKQDGKVLVDGRALDEPYVRQDDFRGADFGPVVVPPESYFVLGDWRSRAKDSRHPDVGFIGRAQIVGPAMTIYASKDPESGAMRWDRVGRVIR